MFEILLAILLGIIAGTFTGLVPGIHVNMIAAFVLGSQAAYSGNPLAVGAFLVSLGITHSFVDFIPSIYLGAPDPSTALSILPGHRYFIAGRGHMAIFLSAVGGVVSMFLLVLLSPLLFVFLPQAYAYMKAAIPFMLAAVVLYMIYLERNRKCSVLVFILSGILGILAFRSPVNEAHVFTALLSGLFGLSTIATTTITDIRPKKQVLNAEVSLRDGISGGFLGFLGGLVAGVLPGVGSSQSAILVNRVSGKMGAKKYIISLGAINTTDVILSIISVYLIGRARSGIAVAIELVVDSVRFEDVLFFTGVALVSAAFAAIATLHISKKVSGLVVPSGYRRINLLVFCFIVASIAFLSGIFGLLIAATGMFLGMYAQAAGVKKSMLMNALVVPVILYFIGVRV